MARDIAFYLNGRPNGGGANSVVQEFTTLAHNFGVGHLVLQQQHLAHFRLAYGWDDRLMAHVHTSFATVPTGAVAVATTNDSVAELRKERGDDGGTILYYVQDYEPLFYAPRSLQHEVSLESYARPNDVIAVVKTAWLKETLLRETFLPVVQIRPSIDRRIYYREVRGEASPRRTLVAMLRPVTPRRAPQRTVAVLNRLAEEAADTIDIVVFGAESDDLATSGLRLDRRIMNAGRLAPSSVARIMRQSHYFVDLSDYQAFGRGLAEGMACGVVPIATRYGAPSEFIADRVSGYLVTPSDLDQSYADIREAIALPTAAFDEMSLAAVTAVAEWNTEATATDWLALAEDVA